MNIELHTITIGELAKGYVDNGVGGVKAYDGKLDVRPPYQREFIYKDKQRDAVVDTVLKGYPLNVMYWVKRDDGTFEVMDGQQRTISICQYFNGDYSFDMRYFHSLQDDEQKKFLDYKLMVYWCEGTECEKLSWFKTINIAGEELTPQELRNAVYHGPFVEDAKKWFSKNGCPAAKIGSDYLNGSRERQEYLETAIEWMCGGKGEAIDQYMSLHQKDPNASLLWGHFNTIITWVEATFEHSKDRSKILKGHDWGLLYKKYGGKVLDTNAIEARIKELLLDDDVTNKKGIIEYVLGEGEKHLSIRAFTESQKLKAYTKQKGVCPLCKKHFDIGEMDADHITPWCEGGHTTNDNIQMLCRICNRMKGSK